MTGWAHPHSQATEDNVHEKHGQHIKCYEEIGVTTWVLENLPEGVALSLPS